jgi:ATP-dependent Lhr-like helicase
MFLSEPLIGVRWGARVLGQIDPSSLSTRDGEQPVILLGGTSWAVRDVDWERRLAWVEPSEDPGRSRWMGAGGALSFEVCQSIRAVLASSEPIPDASRRAGARLDELREAYWFAREGMTSAEQLANNRTRWWTWAGGRANSQVAARLGAGGQRVVSADDLSVTVAGAVTGSELRATVLAAGDVPLRIDARRLDAIKFSAAVPPLELSRLCELRDADPRSLERTLQEPSETVGPG